VVTGAVPNLFCTAAPNLETPTAPRGRPGFSEFRSHCFSLFLIVSHCFLLFLIVSHCFSLLLIASHCFSLLLIVSHCFSLFLIVSHCFSLFLVQIPPPAREWNLYSNTELYCSPGSVVVTASMYFVCFVGANRSEKLRLNLSGS
jgi:hypothetical protein